ncbi:MAG: HAD family hydrolase [Chloroflexi bacterium]|nr:HAD family hydrolase [Chloroflexota bacterium]
MIKAITFDFWGTLYQDTLGQDERVLWLQEVFTEHSQPRSLEEVAAARDRAWAVQERVWLEEHRSISAADWLHLATDSLGVQLPEAVLSETARYLEDFYLVRGTRPRPIDGVQDVVPRLAQRYRLGLISDTGLTPGRVLRQVMDDDGLLTHFGVLTFSDETGVTKPIAEVFLRTLAVLGVTPETAAHIGDLPETDLTGARAVGMRSVLFLGKSQREDGRPLADGVFEDYRELENLLSDLA